MRKYVLTLILIILFLALIWVMCIGFGFGPFKIYSYPQIVKLNSYSEEIYNSLNEKNTNEFQTRKERLDTAVSEYKNIKSQFDSMVNSGAVTKTNISEYIEVYDVDYLLKVLGEYADKNKVKMQMDITKSEDQTALNNQYIIGDLNFVIQGEYIPVTDFLYALENDDALAFEISEFRLEKGGEDLQASFVVKNIPVNSLNISQENN